MGDTTFSDVDLAGQFSIALNWLSQHVVRWETLAVVAQVVFAIRFLCQWVASEKRKESVVPPSFWYSSLAGGLALVLYALFRDPVVLVSAVPSLFIYARNISLVHRTRSKLLTRLVLAVILSAAGFAVFHYDSVANWYWAKTKSFWNSDGAWWIGFGFAAQVIFFMRFAWQWIVSEREKRSFLPVGFWYFSLVGGAMLTIYAIFRDAWLIPGQAAGLVVYIRNLALIHRSKRSGGGNQGPEVHPSRQRHAA